MIHVDSSAKITT